MLRSLVALLRCLVALAAVAWGIPVWPRPRRVEVTGERFAVSSALRVVGEDDVTQALLEKKDAVLAVASVRSVSVRVVGSPATAEQLDRRTDYAYNLTATSQTITVRAVSAFGVVYGLETLTQLMSTGSVAACRIVDFPAKTHRGLHVDVARHFLPLPLLKRTVAALGAAKMNVMHLHLTDSQSFPVVLPSAPELAAQGSFDQAQTYSVSDLRDLVSFATPYGVRLVPEIDVPAHTLSWAKSHPELIVNCSTHSKSSASASDVPALDPSTDQTFDVVERVLKDVAAIFPDDLFHLGFDEVHFKCWLESQRLRDWAARFFGGGTGARDDGEEPRKSRRLQGAQQRGRTRRPRATDVQRLWHGPSKADDATLARKMLGYFLRRTTRFLLQLGKVPVVWQEALEAPPGALPPGSVVETWRCWGGEHEAAANQALARRFDVVDASCWYLDWPSPWRNYYEKKLLRSWPSIEGGEAALWTENIDHSNFECRAWPRTAFVAQLFWHGDVSGASSTEAAADVALFSEHLRRRTGTRASALSDASGATGVEAKGFCPAIDQYRTPRKPPTPAPFKLLTFRVYDTLSLRQLATHTTESDEYVVAFYVSFRDPNRNSEELSKTAALAGFPFSLATLNAGTSALVSTAPITTLGDDCYETGGLVLCLRLNHRFTSNKPAVILGGDEHRVPASAPDASPVWRDALTRRSHQSYSAVAWAPHPDGGGEPPSAPFAFSFFIPDDDVTTWVSPGSSESLAARRRRSRRD